MSNLEKTIDTVDRYFSAHSPHDLDMADIAAFCAQNTDGSTMSSILEEILNSEKSLAEVASRSYAVSPIFTKLMLHRSDAAGWGLRVHLFTPDSDNTHQEPWHEHRWMLGSSVLAGRLLSRNAVAKIVEAPEDVASSDAMYMYNVADKRRVGAIVPVFAGQCVLDNVFDAEVPAGSSYGHHVVLAHALTITEPTVTAVVTGPDARSYASFIEPEPLRYAERPLPVPLTPEMVKTSIQNSLELIESADLSAQAGQSPYPELLAFSS
jgi:hypothetical protein